MPCGCWPALHLLVCAAAARACAARRAGRAACTAPRRRPASSLARLSCAARPSCWSGLFVVCMMAVTAALPAHMISLLRESGLPEGLGDRDSGQHRRDPGARARLLLYFFEHHFDLHLANRLIPCLIPLGTGRAAAGAVARPPTWRGPGAAGAVRAALWPGQRHDDHRQGHGHRAVREPRACGQPERRARCADGAGAGRCAAACWACCGAARAGYRYGLWLLLALSCVGVVALMLAQRITRRPRL